MKTRKTEEIYAQGVDQRWKASNEHAEDIKNCRIDSVGLGWRNDRGWEPLIPVDDNSQVELSSLDNEFLRATSPCRFLDVWTRHGGSEVYYLEERGGVLTYTFGNQETPTTVILDTDRNLPKADDPGTQLTPFGRFALIQNGYDRPIKFWGRSYVSEFGWSQAPNAPILVGVNPSQIDEPNLLEARQGAWFISNLNRDPPEGGGNSDARKIWPFDSTVGFGPEESGKSGHYRYKVSFISDTGSESPLSESTGVFWTIDGEGTEQENARVGIIIKDIPVGDTNVVARKIYRTKDLTDNPAEVYYELKTLTDNITTDYIDFVPDSGLLETAPASTDSILLPQSFKYAAAFNGCIFIAGGDDLSTKIHYSDRFLPEQFDSFRFFDVGMRTGGEITALVPYNNNLIVFRANAIEVISPISDDAYTIGTLTPNIGTRATNTIKEVPGVGLVFLSRDGCYVVTGGQSGAGAVTLDVKPFSATLHGEWERLSEGSLARATATYSPREKEYWVHYPVDGDTENTRGAVYHAQIGQWSLRNLTDGVDLTTPLPDTLENAQMAFTQLATDPEGWIIIGTYPDYPRSAESTLLPTQRTFYPGLGLQVWSAACYNGLAATSVNIVIVPEPPSTTYTYTFAEVARRDQDHLYESVWWDFGDDSLKKRVHSVELEMVSQGYRDLTLEYFSDYTFAATTGGTSAPMIIEKYETATSEPVWYSATPGKVKNLASWGDNWSNGQLCRVRFDIHTGLVSQFKFRLKAGAPFHLISYQIEFTGSEQKTITRRGGSGT